MHIMTEMIMVMIHIWWWNDNGNDAHNGVNDN